MLSFGEIGFKQLIETYTSWLMYSEVTSKIVGSISVVNMTDLIGKKKRFPREFPELLDLVALQIIIINQVLTCGEIGFKQSCDVYTTCLIPSSEVTSKIVGPSRW